MDRELSSKFEELERKMSKLRQDGESNTDVKRMFAMEDQVRENTKLLKITEEKMADLEKQVKKQKSTLNTLNLKLETQDAAPKKKKEDDPNYQQYAGAKNAQEREHTIDCCIERLLDLGMQKYHPDYKPPSKHHSHSHTHPHTPHM